MFGINSFAGTAGTYAYLMKLQSRWNEKQDKGKYTEKSSPQEEDPIIRQLNDMREQRQKSCTKETIINKMSTGKKLTREEMEYLQREDPATYQKAKEIQDAQKSYKNALRNCKTKEDVQRLKTAQMGATLTRVNAISNNPNIPKGQKMALLLHENAKMNAILEAEEEFIESGQYNSLPTDEERKEAMKQAAEVQREDLSTERPEKIQDTEEDAESPSPAPETESACRTEETVSEEGKTEASGNKRNDPPQSANAGSHKKKPDHPGSGAAYARGTDAYQQSTSSGSHQRKKLKISRKA